MVSKLRVRLSLSLKATSYIHTRAGNLHVISISRAIASNKLDAKSVRITFIVLESYSNRILDRLVEIETWEESSGEIKRDRCPR